MAAFERHLILRWADISKPFIFKSIIMGLGKKRAHFRSATHKSGTFCALF